MSMLTVQNFLAAYRQELIESYAWARDPEKLSRFMQSVEASVRSKSKSWNKDGDAVTRAWKAIGGKGRLTWKMLESLP